MFIISIDLVYLTHCASFEILPVVWSASLKILYVRMALHDSWRMAK